jgi:hypothetical protein
VIAAALALLLWPRAAAAQTDEAEARRLDGLAREAFESGRFEACASLWSDAHARMSYAGFLKNAGRCWGKAGRVDRQAELASRYLSALAADDRDRPRAEAEIAELRAKVAVVAVSASDGRPADVLVDGELRGRAPIEVALSPGSRAIALVRGGTTVAERTYVAGAGAQDPVALEIRPQEPEPGPGPGPEPEPEPEPRPEPEPPREGGAGPLPSIAYWGAIGAGALTVGLATVTAVDAVAYHDGSPNSLGEYDAGQTWSALAFGSLPLLGAIAVDAIALSIETDGNRPPRPLSIALAAATFVAGLGAGVATALWRLDVADANRPDGSTRAPDGAFPIVAIGGVGAAAVAGGFTLGLSGGR